MTYKEIYDHLAKDKKKVDIKKGYFRPKAIKAFKQRRVFPAWVWYDYTIPATKNHYVIFYYAPNIKYATQPECDSFCALYEDNQRHVIKWGASPYRSKKGDLMLMRTLNIYSSHFIQRYNERYIKDFSLSSNDIICRYLSRNKTVTPILVDEEVSRNCKEYGEYNNIGFRVSDGMCLGSSYGQDDPNREDIVAQMYYYRTFLSKNDLSDKQRDTISTRYDEMWEKTRADYEAQAVNGKITLTLDP